MGEGGSESDGGKSAPKSREDRREDRADRREERGAKGDLRRADNAFDATERKLFNTKERLEDADSESARAERLKKKQADLLNEKKTDEKELHLAELRVDLLARDVDISEADLLRLEGEFGFTFTKDSLTKGDQTLYFPRSNQPLHLALVPPDGENPQLEVRFETDRPVKITVEFDSFCSFADTYPDVFPQTPPPAAPADSTDPAAPAAPAAPKKNVELKSEATARVINELLRNLGEGKASGMDGAFQSVQLVMLRLQVAMNGNSFKLWAEAGKTAEGELDAGHLAVLEARGIVVTRAGTDATLEFSAPDENQPEAPTTATITTLKETLGYAKGLKPLSADPAPTDFSHWHNLYQSFFTQSTEASAIQQAVLFKDYSKKTETSVKAIREKITPPAAAAPAAKPAAAPAATPAAKPAAAPAKPAPAPATPAKPAETTATPPTLQLDGTEPSAALLVLALEKVYGKDLNQDLSMLDLVKRNPKRIQAALKDVSDAYRTATTTPAAAA